MTRMQIFQWCFVVGLIGVAVLSSFFFLFHQSQSEPSQEETPSRIESTISDSPSTPNFAESTSSGFINPEAIPQ